MNNVAIYKEINKEFIDKLKNNANDLSSFLQEQNEGTIVYVLEKLGRLDNDHSRKPLLNLLNHTNENIRTLSIRKLLKGEDYRIEVVTLIDAEFLQFAVDFFKKIVDAKA